MNATQTACVCSLTHTHTHSRVGSDQLEWSKHQGERILYHCHSLQRVYVCVLTLTKSGQDLNVDWAFYVWISVCERVCVCVKTTACPTSTMRRLIIKGAVHINYQLLALNELNKETMSRCGHGVNVFWMNDECLALRFLFALLLWPVATAINLGCRDREGERWEWHNLDSLASKATSLSQLYTHRACLHCSAHSHTQI